MDAHSPRFYQVLTTAKRLVIKLGTQVVVDASGGLSLDRLSAVASQCAQLVKNGREVILVSSGAVGLGQQTLARTLEPDKSRSLVEKQAFAAIGQPLLMEAYRQLFSQYDLVTAQVLLTAFDFSDRKHYLNLKQTLETLLRLGVIPIMNENDTVSTMELRDEGYTKGFGDNDKLSALVASKLDADLLVILTNVDGIYTDNPDNNPNAEKIPILENFESLREIQTLGQSTMGRGGMSSKLEAARVAAISGIHTYIASGLRMDCLQPLLSKYAVQVGKTSAMGTLILPQASMRAKKRWIGVASGYYGILTINSGARTALVENQASLLPIGITGVSGEFSARQVVSIQDENGVEIGRGLTDFSSEEIEKIKGVRSEKVAEILYGTGNGENDASLEGGRASAVLSRQAVIHRDNLVVFEEYGV